MHTVHVYYTYYTCITHTVHTHLSNLRGYACSGLFANGFNDRNYRLCGVVGSNSTV